MLITLVIHIRPFLDPLEYLIFMAHQHLAESRCRRLYKLAVAFRWFPTFKPAAPYAVCVRDEHLWVLFLFICWSASGSSYPARYMLKPHLSIPLGKPCLSVRCHGSNRILRNKWNDSIDSSVEIVYSRSVGACVKRRNVNLSGYNPPLLIRRFATP